MYKIAFMRHYNKGALGGFHGSNETGVATRAGPSESSCVSSSDRRGVAIPPGPVRW